MVTLIFRRVCVGMYGLTQSLYCSWGCIDEECHAHENALHMLQIYVNWIASITQLPLRVFIQTQRVEWQKSMVKCDHIKHTTDLMSMFLSFTSYMLRCSWIADKLSQCKVLQLYTCAQVFLHSSTLLFHILWWPLRHLLASHSVNVDQPSMLTNNMITVASGLSALLYWSQPKVHLRGCISLLLPRLPKLPSQRYSNGPGNLGNLGKNKGLTSASWV